MSSNFVQFFRSAADGDDNGEDDDVEREPPRIPWFGPPEDELGAVVPLGVVVGRSANGVVALRHGILYSTGLALDVFAAGRGLTGAQANRLFHEQHLFEEDEEPPPGFLRIGLELPDGARVSNLGGRMRRRRLMRPDEEPDEPVFVEHGGGGASSSGGRVSMNPAFWLWPLPGAGTIRVSCEWPLVEIPLSTVELDGDLLRAAAGRILPLWRESSA